MIATIVAETAPSATEGTTGDHPGRGIPRPHQVKQPNQQQDRFTHYGLKEGGSIEA
ncbi:hypothetical protein [Nonomuraea fuscirosea]|uniref:hypothetical protein n=1 Tax=Nonomuraea fuscirosea TaxID=1291556 RepID=UPI0015E64A41|nr:hypothetical protein [Nonomuraea fuscirosea]